MIDLMLSALLNSAEIKYIPVFEGNDIMKCSCIHVDNYKQGYDFYCKGVGYFYAEDLYGSYKEAKERLKEYYQNRIDVFRAKLKAEPYLLDYTTQESKKDDR